MEDTDKICEVEDGKEVPGEGNKVPEDKEVTDDKEEEEKFKVPGKDKGNLYCKNEGHGTETPRTFLTKEAKLGHMARAHKCSYSARGCPFYYEMEAELGKHLLTCHPVANLENACIICQASVEKEYLQRHNEVMHNQCICCGKWFLGLMELKKHWEVTEGACKSAGRPVTSKGAATALEPPEALTMANLPNFESNHEGHFNEAMERIINAAMPAGEREEVKRLVSSYSFHQRHMQNIEGNRWLAQTQTTQFLEAPSFQYPVTVKERNMDKALDSTEPIDLSPYVNKRFENYLTADALNNKITGYSKQYYLREGSAVFLLVAHLSGENQDTLRSTYKRHPHDLTYKEILQCLQTKYFNIDLKNLRDGVGNLKRGHQEHLLPFYNRAYKLASLASINFEEPVRNKWVEQQVRAALYKALDTNLRLEIDAIEARSPNSMSSATMLDTFISRANLKSSTEFDDETLSTTVQQSAEEHVRKIQRSGNMSLKMADVMDKLNITEGQARHCWACGAGHKQLNNEMYHSRGKCDMPWYNGDPHECVDGIFLMHKDMDCPYYKDEESNEEEDNEEVTDRATASDVEDNSSDEEQNAAMATKNASDNSESGDEE
jgi:hypothetical protein